MASKKLYLQILVRVGLIVLCSILLGYLVFEASLFHLAVICLLIIVALTVNLISFLNRTNSNIKFFFDSVKNNETNLTFAYNEKDKSLAELHMSMNRVSQQIQKLKVENIRQEQFFRKILELLATGIITYDNNGYIHHINTAAKNLLSADNLTHLSQLERLDPKLFSAITETGPSQKKLVTLNSKHGEIILSLKSASRDTDNHELTILSIQDIKNELDEKELEAWMKLIRVLMHEIMNSIAPITSLSDSLRKIFKQDNTAVPPGKISETDIEKTLRGLETIREQGSGLMRFVESFRKLSAIPRPEIRKFTIAHLFDRVAALAGQIEKNRPVTVTFADKSPGSSLRADESLVTQVLINLIRNAFEANDSNPDCRITVTASASDDNCTEICVADNGPGIAEENLENIFVPFFTTRKNGSGIGLSLSRQIMGMHGGSLTVRSVQGKETVFCMRFSSPVNGRVSRG